MQGGTPPKTGWSDSGAFSAWAASVPASSVAVKFSLLPLCALVDEAGKFLVAEAQFRDLMDKYAQQVNAAATAKADSTKSIWVRPSDTPLKSGPAGFIHSSSGNTKAWFQRDTAQLHIVDRFGNTLFSTPDWGDRVCNDGTNTLHYATDGNLLIKHVEPPGSTPPPQG